MYIMVIYNDYYHSIAKWPPVLIPAVVYYKPVLIMLIVTAQLDAMSPTVANHVLILLRYILYCIYLVLFVYKLASLLFCGIMASIFTSFV